VDEGGDVRLPRFAVKRIKIVVGDFGREIFISESAEAVSKFMDEDVR
jgi:hypothetical protein